ncbi:hypothetical protein SEA_SKOG_26 [Gordonia phage Skog]|uniref:Uncharacterized protein n=1 Tax=Gordonia phage Skog TaxID=2704033 RepID=A0A6G6XJA8_9CAUD|nr:hypothetical protein KHQ85_gp026 [Gordonia phage Skog]QIG58178.1 hypothetical protein SEA_SKOG_26 [Gordonia phage Skog]
MYPTGSLIQDTPATAAYTKAVHHLRDLMAKYSGFGAEDTEPRWVANDAIASFLKSEEVHIPESAYEWQLYSSQPGAEKAAKEMSAALRAIIDTIPVTLANPF